ncbi:MAG TPA: hypothetical protein VEF33_09305 [Syntrophales bacterium]|nr:hypothetical protein [Syntrophales bacterium]
MATKYYMVLDDYQDHALALGLMLGHWGEFETCLMRMMEFLFQIPHDHVNHHKTDFVYKEFVSIKSKITLLERLNRWFVEDKPLMEEIKKLLSKARTINKERNNYVHARWISYAGYGETSNKLIRISLASPSNINELYKPTKHVTPQDILNFSEEIVKLSLSFQELLDRVLPSATI